MKKIIISFMLTFLCVGIFAQVLSEEVEPVREDEEEIKTIFGKDKSNGGYFDLYFNYTQIMGESALETGTRMSLILKHSLAIGIEGTGFITDVFSQNNEDFLVWGGYGGFTIEPIILPKYPVHISLPVMLGGGASVFTSVDDSYVDVNLYPEEVEGFLIARPGLEVEFNVTRYFRFCLNASYRFIGELGLGDDFRAVSSKDLQGFSYGISFKLGKF